MRILVAEDEKDLNRLLSARLKAENYSVDSCFVSSSLRHSDRPEPAS